MLEDLVRMVCTVLFLSLQLQLIALPSCPVLNSLDTLDLTIGHTTTIFTSNISFKMDSNFQKLSRVSLKRNTAEGNIVGEVVPGRGDITWIKRTRMIEHSEHLCVYVRMYICIIYVQACLYFLSIACGNYIITLHSMYWPPGTTSPSIHIGNYKLTNVQLYTPSTSKSCRLTKVIEDSLLSVIFSKWINF